MTTRRKRKPAKTGPSWTKRIILACVLVALALAATLALTEPRQLPALVADHQAVRKAYHWRDETYQTVYHWMYPLASLREDTTAPTDGTGYNKQDRQSLEQLIDSKEGTTP